MQDIRREILDDFVWSFGLVGWGLSHKGTYRYDSAWARFLRSVCELAGAAEPYALAVDAVFEEQARKQLSARVKRMAKGVRRWMAELQAKFPLPDDPAPDLHALLVWVRRINPAELRDVVVEATWEAAMETELVPAVWSAFRRAASAMESLPVWVERCRERCLCKLDLEAAVEAVSCVSAEQDG